MATFMERLAFLQKVPTLMKATADDENPCPGYLFEEIGKISHESVGCGQCLLEYLLERLQMESCHVKLKVLKIFVHLCANGSNNFLTELRRNSTFIQQASVYSGPPDPIHGTAFYQKVRHTAQEVARLLFTDILSNKSSISPPSQPPPTMGMGSGTHHRSGMQGFGYSPGAAGGDSLLDKIQKAAEVMASAVLPPTEHQGIRLHESHYRAVVAPSTSIEMAVPACAYNVPPRKPKAVTQWCPGQVGGGWEETDSGNSSSHNSSQDIGANSRASLGSKSASTGSHSGASRESSGDLSERVEALQLGDCGQEMSLINRLTAGSRVFLSREESQHFIKECFILNCEVVLDLLSNKLQDPSNTVKMRALCSVSCLLTSDLLSLEQMFGATQRRLCRLSEGAPGSVANKATKILRQFEALMGGSPHTPTQDAATNTQPPTSTYSDPLLSTHTTDNEDLNHNQPDISATGGTQVQYEPPSSSSLAFDQIDSSAETTNDSKDEKRSPLQQNQTEPCWPSEAGELESSNGGCLSSPAEIQLEQPIVSPLSLFNGMELVTKGRPLFQRETSVTKDTLKENPAMQNSIDICETNVGAPSVYTTAAPDSSHPVSAFSFLSF